MLSDWKASPERTELGRSIMPALPLRTSYVLSRRILLLLQAMEAFWQEEWPNRPLPRSKTSYLLRRAVVKATPSELPFCPRRCWALERTICCPKEGFAMGKPCLHGPRRPAKE